MALVPWGANPHRCSAPPERGPPQGKAEGPGGDIHLCFSGVWLQPPSSPLVTSAWPVSPGAHQPTHPPRAWQVLGLGSAAGSREAIWWGKPGFPWLWHPSRLPAERACWPQGPPGAVAPGGNLGLGFPPPVPLLPCSPSFFLSTSCLYSSSSWSVSWLKGFGGSGSVGASSRDASLASVSPR